MNLFGKLLVGVGAFAACTASASAADLLGIGKPSVYGNKASESYEYAAPAIGWTDFYVGAHAGSAAAGDEVGAFGVHAGFNWQSDDHYVIGMEGEYTGVDAIDVSALSSIRGKIGLAYRRSLIYGTAGVGFLQFQDLVGDDLNATGFVGGVGFDYKLKPSLSFGFDVSFYKFDNLGGVLDVDNVTIVNALARLTFHINNDTNDAY